MNPLPNEAALPVIDAQKRFDDPTHGFRSNPHAANIAQLLEAWRRTGRRAQRSNKGAKLVQWYRSKTVPPSDVEGLSLRDHTGIETTGRGDQECEWFAGRRRDVLARGGTRRMATRWDGWGGRRRTGWRLPPATPAGVDRGSVTLVWSSEVGSSIRRFLRRCTTSPYARGEPRCIRRLPTQA